MNNELSKRYQQHFFAHPRRWGWALLLGWFGSNALVLATTKLMEMKREGHDIAFWEPLSWELSSAFMIVLLVPMGIYIHDRWLANCSLKACIGFHLLLTVPFSLLHVGGMVAIRHLCYWVMDADYSFGNIAVELLYEYRKDAQTYLTLLLLIFGFRLIHRRLQGEASYLATEDETGASGTESSDIEQAGREQSGSEQSELEKRPEILLIKKLGREFLVKTADIEWIEASGNYANLHLRGSVYPMRITMDKLEKLLPVGFVRIHRSSIVNLHRIQQVQPLDSGDYEVILDCQKTLTLSRRYRDNFKTLLSLG